MEWLKPGVNVYLISVLFASLFCIVKNETMGNPTKSASALTLSPAPSSDSSSEDCLPHGSKIKQGQNCSRCCELNCDAPKDSAWTCTNDKVDCVGSWSQWSTCSQSCGSLGKKRRSFEITKPAFGGKTCSVEDGYTVFENCSIQTCPIIETPATSASAPNSSPASSSASPSTILASTPELSTVASSTTESSTAASSTPESSTLSSSTTEFSTVPSFTPESSTAASTASSTPESSNLSSSTPELFTAASSTTESSTAAYSTPESSSLSSSTPELSTAASSTTESSTLSSSTPDSSMVESSTVESYTDLSSEPESSTNSSSFTSEPWDININSSDTAPTPEKNITVTTGIGVNATTSNVTEVVKCHCPFDSKSIGQEEKHNEPDAKTIALFVLGAMMVVVLVVGMLYIISVKNRNQKYSYASSDVNEPQIAMRSYSISSSKL